MAFEGVKIGALWKNKGEGYSGTVDATELDKFIRENGTSHMRIVLFKNGYKEQDKHPDLVLYAAVGKQGKSHVKKPDEKTDTKIPF